MSARSATAVAGAANAARPGPSFPGAGLVAAAFLGGVAGGAVLGGPWWYGAALALLVAASLALADPPRRAGLAVLALAVAAAAAGHARFAEAEARPLPALPPPGEHEVVGVLLDDARVRDSIARVDLALESVDAEPAAGRVRLLVRAPVQPLVAGERLRLRGEVEPPPEVEDFDYAAFLRQRGVIGVLAFPGEVERLGREPSGAQGRLRDLRRWAARNVERSLPEPPASLAMGVLTGERRDMPDDVEEALRVTGTTHLVVVSGQNVALLLGSAVAVLTLAVPRRQAALLSLALLGPYVALIGGDPPLVRAAIMAVGVVAASVTGRRTPGWLYLLYAAALMLAVDPMLARDVAFQLSATATAGVIVVAPALRDRVLARLPRAGPGVAAAVELASVATGAALAVVPVQAAAFERLSLVTIPANVAVAPFYEATVAVALLAALLGWLEPAAAALGLAAGAVPRAFLAVVALFARLPAAEVAVAAPLALGMAWYAGLGGVTAWLARGALPRPVLDSMRASLARPLALAVVAGGLWLVVLAPAEEAASVVVLDVGQGLAVLVRDGAKEVLIDTGPPGGAVVQALGRAKVEGGIQAVVLTHAEADHAGGVVSLQRREAVASLLASERTLDTLADEGVSGEPVDIGDRIRLSARTVIEVLSPPVASAGRAHRSENDASLVLLVTIGSRRVLVAADIEAQAEGWLVRSGYDLRADVLVVPHHGSASSSTPEFIAAVDPAVAIVSAGEDNRYGHPALEVIERYAGAMLYRTDVHGDVTVRGDGERLWVSAAR